MRARGEVARQLRHLVALEVDEQPFGDHEDALRAPADVLQQTAARLDVGQVERDPFQSAVRTLLGEDVALVREDGREVDLDPLERGRERQPVGPGVESRGEVEDEIGARGDLAGDEVVEQVGARDERPLLPHGPAERRVQRLTTLAGESPRERIAKHRVRPLRFARAVDGHPACGFGDVRDRRRG